MTFDGTSTGATGAKAASSAATGVVVNGAVDAFVLSLARGVLSRGLLAIVVASLVASTAAAAAGTSTDGTGLWWCFLRGVDVSVDVAPSSAATDSLASAS